MKKSIFVFFNIFFLTFLLINAKILYSQEDADKALIKRGSILFKQEKYIPAILDFKEIINEHEKSLYVPQAYMLLSKSYFKKGELDKAESTAVELRKKYPQSPYFYWANYLIAAVKFKKGDFRQSAEILAKLASGNIDKTLRERSLSALRYSVIPLLNDSLFIKKIGENGIKLSDLENTENFGYEMSDAAFVKVKPDTVFSDTGVIMGKNGRPQDFWKNSPVIRIGLLAPLSGSDSILGIQLFNGVKKTFEQVPLIQGKKVELIVEDTQSDAVVSVLKTRKLIWSDVAAIIGPVLSESTIPAAVEAQSSGIPFIAPTANDIGLTDIGSFIFQLNANPVVQAEELSELAAKKLKFRTFSVIASNDWWGKAAAATFTKKMNEYGCSEIWTDYLNSEGPEFNKSLIEKIIEHAPKPSVPQDSAAAADTTGTSAENIAGNDTTVAESEHPPVNTIDCIFISAASEDDLQIASLIMEYNIKTVLLGDSGWWSNEKVFDGEKEYIEGAYIIAPQGEFSGGKGVSDFNIPADNNSLSLVPFMKGADAALIIIQCLKNGAYDPVSIVAELEKIKDFRGVSSVITIDPSRHINNNVKFVNVKNGVYYPFKE